MFGKENRMPIDLVYGPVPRYNPIPYVDYVEDLKEKFTDAYANVRENLKTAAKRRKDKYDLKVHQKKFRIGDEVWIFIPRRRRGRYPKWQKYYEGPYIVLGQTGRLNYRVQKKPRGRIFVTHLDKMLLYKAFEEPRAPNEAAEGEVNVNDPERNMVAEEFEETNTEVPEEPRENIVPGIPRLRPRRNLRRPARYDD